MDAVMQLWALFAIAAAIYAGLRDIASAIRAHRYGVHDVRLNGHINLVKDDHGTPS